MNGIEYGLFLGAFTGLVAGLFPLVKGVGKNQLPMSLLGLFACCCVGAIAGLFLSVPCAAIFWVIIAKMPDKSDAYKNKPEQESKSDGVEMASDGVKTK